MEQEKKRVIVVSTRPPTEPLSGGMAPAVSRACKSFGKVVWYAVENANGNRQEFNKEAASGGTCSVCPKNPDNIVQKTVSGMLVKILQVATGIWNSHYNKFSNEYLWPHLHGHHDKAVDLETTDTFGHGYVNDKIAQTIAEDLGDDHETPIWIHDYHHFDLPAYLRAHGVKNPIILFSHVPMPDPETVRTLPAIDQGRFLEIVRGLSYCDAAAFQTPETARRAMVFLGVKNPPRLGSYETCNIGIPVGDEQRNVTIGNFPISIDTPDIVTKASTGTLSPTGQAVADTMVAENIFINFERCDYSKGILQRLLAFELLLERHPELRGKCQIVIGAEPTRGDIAAYQEYAQSVMRICGRINENQALYCDGKPPVLLQYNNVPHDDLLKLLRQKEGQRIIGTVTPYTDGMNLVAKEFAAAQDPENAGVLLLSSGAGAGAELYLNGQGALIYDSSAKDPAFSSSGQHALPPCDDSVEAIYHAMLEAIRMPQHEANRRCETMQATLRAADLQKWACEHVNLFEKCAEKKIAPTLSAANDDADPKTQADFFSGQPQQHPAPL